MTRSVSSRVSGDAAGAGVRCVPAVCPCCGAAGPHPVLLRVRHLSPFNPGSSPSCTIDVVRCDRCGLSRLDPRPDDETLASLQRNSLGDAESQVGSFEAGNANPDYPAMLARRLRDAGFPVPGGKLIDVGCGGGDLLAAVAGDLEATGVGLDASEAALVRAERRFPAHGWIRGQVASGAIPGSEFDAATLIHVLEHLSAPVADLRTIRSWLGPGGLLLIEVPNGEFYFSRFYSLFLESPKRLIAAAYRLLGRRVPFTARGFYPFHLTLFGPDSLRAVVARSGFEIVGLDVSTCRLQWWLKENRRDRNWPRYLVNRFKLALAKRGLGDNLFLVARRPPERAPAVKERS